MLGATLSASARADTTEQRYSAPLYRRARAHPVTDSERLLRQAVACIREALRATPADFRTLCERVKSMHVPGDRRAAQLGQRRAIAALARQSLERRAYLDDALARLDGALGLDASNPRVLETRARTLSLWEEPVAIDECRVRRRDAEAIDAFERLTHVAASFHAAEVAFQLGILHTRVHAFESAQADYARALTLALDARDVATTQGNLAEVTMLAGDPAAALPHYERALQLTPAGRDYALLSLGLAVALDRLGEHDAALQKAAIAIDSSGRSLAILHTAGVFFEPDYEVYYYEGLGNEALAQLMPEARALSFESAAASYRAFLDAADGDNPYRVNARSNLDHVEALLDADDGSRL